MATPTIYQRLQACKASADAVSSTVSESLNAMNALISHNRTIINKGDDVARIEGFVQSTADAAAAESSLMFFFDGAIGAQDLAGISFTVTPDIGASTKTAPIDHKTVIDVTALVKPIAGIKAALASAAAAFAEFEREDTKTLEDMSPPTQQRIGVQTGLNLGVRNDNAMSSLDQHGNWNSASPHHSPTRDLARGMMIDDYTVLLGLRREIEQLVTELASLMAGPVAAQKNLIVADSRVKRSQGGKVVGFVDVYELMDRIHRKWDYFTNRQSAFGFDIVDSLSEDANEKTGDLAQLRGMLKIVVTEIKRGVWSDLRSGKEID